MPRLPRLPYRYFVTVSVFLAGLAGAVCVGAFLLGAVPLGAGLPIFVLCALLVLMTVYHGITLRAAQAKQRAVEAELIEKEQRYRDLFDHSQGMILIHDLAGRILTVNPATVRSLDYPESEIVGSNLLDFFPDDEKAIFPAFLREIENSGLSSGFLPLVARRGANLIWRYTSILVEEAGKEPYVIGHAQDVTELVEAQRQLKSLALTDELTGLYNRRGFLTLADQQLLLEKHKGTARGLTLMFADMDGLKAINDKYGHEAGSDAIIAFAKVLKSALRGADLVCRWGGDEFVVLTIGSRKEHSEELIARVREHLDHFNMSSGMPYEIAFSVGVASVDHVSELTFDQIVAQADEAMYVDKRQRKAARAAGELAYMSEPVPVLS